MSSDFERFFEKDRFAVVGFSKERPFPILTYRALKKRGSTVYAIDPTCDQIDGDPTYPALNALPGPVQGAILETPKEQTADWVTQAADAGIADVWIHMKTETPEALLRGEELGLNVLFGTCAVMYATKGFSFHSIHKWINKALGIY